MKHICQGCLSPTDGPFDSDMWCADKTHGLCPKCAMKPENVKLRAEADLRVARQLDRIGQSHQRHGDSTIVTIPWARMQ